MNTRNHIFLLTILLVTFLFNSLYSQQVSAEFVSAHQPAKLNGGEQVRDGIQNLLIDKDRLYVVNRWAGLQILDVRDIKKPKELGAFIADDGSQNVFLDNHFAYLSATIGGVRILDVSDPEQIKQVGKIRTVGDAYWAVARYPYVFVAEADKGLHVYSIRNVDSPVAVGHPVQTKWAWNLFIAGDRLYLGDKKEGLIIFDCSDPTNLKELGRYSNLKTTKSIQVEKGIAYIADGAEGLVLLDVSHPARPRFLSKLKTGGFVYDATNSGNTVFLANGQLHRLDIANVSDPEHPRLEGRYQFKSKVFAALKQDVYVYVAADSQSVALRYDRPPKLIPIGNREVDENQLLTVQASASDPDKDPIVYSISNLPQGAVFDSLSGLLSWTPTYEQSGIYKKIRITATEQTVSALKDTTTFSITVVHVNRPPVLPDIRNFVVNENEVLTFTIPKGSDPDREDQGKLTYSASNMPQGALFDGSNRSFSWQPTYEQSGIYVIAFTVSDPAGGTATKTSTITVKHVDRKPVLAEVGSKEIPENQTLTFTLKGSDPDKEDQDRLSYQAQNLPKGAHFDPATAKFSWTPTYEQSGEYKNLLFIFKAGALSDSVTVDVKVDHVNRLPKITTLKDQTVDENKTLFFTVSGSDPDAEDAGKLVYSAANLPQGAKFNPDSLSFRWKPTYEQSGVYKNIIFIVQDPAGLRDSSIITITVKHVNRPPVLAAIEAKEIDENKPLAFNLQGSDPDKEDQGRLTYSVKGLPQGAKLKGAHFSWQPTYDQSGVYELTFTVSDGVYKNSKTMHITVHHVNRPPLLQPVANQTEKENQTLTFKLTGSDPDKEDAGKLKIRAEDLPQGAQFDSLKNVFNWTPTFEQAGKYTVKFKISDPAGLTDEKAVNISVEQVNRTPVFPVQPEQTVDENHLLTVQLLPASDPDKEDKGKLVYSVKNLPEGARFDAASLQLNWTPTYDQSGTYTVIISVTDGGFTVSRPLKITVNNVNRAPQIIQPAPQTIDENKAWNFKVVYRDADKEDAGKLKIKAENLPQGARFDPVSGTFSWTPTFEQAGHYGNIKVTVSDPAGLTDEKVFSIIVNNVDRSPKLKPIPLISGKENEKIGFNLSGSDPDKEDTGKLIYSAQNLPQGAALNAQSGAFEWTPTFTQAGNYTIHFKVTDSGNLNAAQNARIKVEDVNRAPLLQDVAAQKVKENQELSFKILGSDKDTDNTLTYTARNVPKGARFNAASQTFSWKPTFTQAGEYNVTFELSDGKAKVSKTAQITVVNVNRPPTISGPSSAEVTEGESINLSYSANDADSDALTFSANGLPSGISINSQSGKISGNTSEGQAGTYSVTVTVSDGTDSASTKTAITVKPKPSPAPPDTTQH